MVKQVRSFNLDNEVGNAIDEEARMLGQDKKSQLVNELLKEALDRRAKLRFARETITVAEGVAVGTALLVVLWILVLL